MLQPPDEQVSSDGHQMSQTGGWSQGRGEVICVMSRGRLGLGPRRVPYLTFGGRAIFDVLGRWTVQ